MLVGSPIINDENIKWISDLYRPQRWIVFASGRGSNLNAMLEAKLPIVGAVLNVVDSGAQLICERHEIPYLVIDHKPFGRDAKGRQQHEEKIFSAIEQYWGLSLAEDTSVWIALAGYMRLISPWMIAQLQVRGLGIGRLINIHPSLLPSFPGVDAYKQAWDYGCQLAGSTIHFVDEKMDHGMIISQEAHAMDFDLGLDAWKEAALKREHAHYCRTMRFLTHDMWGVMSPRRFVRGNLTKGSLVQC